MPDSTPSRASGLFTRPTRRPSPLAGVSIDAEISNVCARVTVTQRYVNRESTPIEAVYVFPLDEGAAVCGFEAIIDGTLVVGEVKERERRSGCTTRRWSGATARSCSTKSGPTCSRRASATCRRARKSC